MIGPGIDLELCPRCEDNGMFCEMCRGDGWISKAQKERCMKDRAFKVHLEIKEIDGAGFEMKHRSNAFTVKMLPGEIETMDGIKAAMRGELTRQVDNLVDRMDWTRVDATALAGIKAGLEAGIPGDLEELAKQGFKPESFGDGMDPAMVAGLKAGAGAGLPGQESLTTKFVKALSLDPGAWPEEPLLDPEWIRKKKPWWAGKDIVGYLIKLGWGVRKHAMVKWVHSGGIACPERKRMVKITDQMIIHADPTKDQKELAAEMDRLATRCG